MHYCHGEDERDKRLVLRIDQCTVFHSLAAAVHIQLLHVDRVRLAVLQDQKKVLQVRSPRMRHHRHPRNIGSPRPRHLRIFLRRILTAAAGMPCRNSNVLMFHVPLWQDLQRRSTR